MLTVAVIALRQPNGHVSAGGSASSAAQQSSTPTRPTSPSKQSRSRAPRSSAPHSGAAQPGSAIKSVPLVVLNNTTIQGLAATAAHQFEQGGWTVSHYDNYQNEIISTCAYYDATNAGAKAAAEALQAQFPAIKRVKPKFAELPAGPVVVVLTPDYTTS